MQNSLTARKNRMDSIRASLQINPIMKKNTIMVQNKLEKRKKRKQSLTMNQESTEIELKAAEEDDSSIKAISKFDEKYQIGEKIGQGSNGLVRKCYLKETKQIFAVKSMMMDDEHILFLKKNFKQIRSLDFECIVKYRAMYLNLQKHICYLVMDYESLPNLGQVTGLTELQIMKIIFQLIQTLKYIHSQGMCHRDIKPDNILYDKMTQKIKIIDFGISKKIKERSYKRQMLTITGTLFYRAPEMFLGGGYDEKVDIWAAGVTLYYLVSGRTPFESEYHSETIKNIEKTEVIFGPQWDNFSYLMKDFTLRLLKKRSQRLNAAEALSHLWFQDLKGNIDLTKSDNLTFQFNATLGHRNSEQPDFRFQRSLTTHKPKLSIDSVGEEGEGKSQQKISSLAKWLTGSDDEDFLIQIDSEGEQLQKESPFIAKKGSEL